MIQKLLFICQLMFNDANAWILDIVNRLSRMGRKLDNY